MSARTWFDDFNAVGVRLKNHPNRTRNNRSKSLSGQHRSQGEGDQEHQEKAMANITVKTFKRGPKKGQKEWKVMIRMVGFKTDVTYHDSESDAKSYEVATEERYRKIREEDADPRSWLPASGNWDDEKLVDLIDRFGRSDSCTDRHWKLLPVVRNAIDNKITIGELQSHWVSEYVEKMRTKITRRKTFYAYESIFCQLCFINAAMEWRCKKLKMDRRKLTINTKEWPKGWEAKRKRRFEKGEEAALMATLAAVKSPSSAHWGLLIRLAVETCTRLQELILAEWREFDFEDDGDLNWLIPAEHTKAKTERLMPLTDGALAALRELKALANPDNPRLFHPMGAPDSVSALFHRYSLRAGLIDFRFHDLRHEGISRFVSTQTGYRLLEISTMVGHKDTEMTKRYTHLRGRDVSRKMIRAVPPPPSTQAAPQSFNQPTFSVNAASMRIQSWIPTASLAAAATPPPLAEARRPAMEPIGMPLPHPLDAPSAAPTNSKVIRAEPSAPAVQPSPVANAAIASIDGGRVAWSQMNKIGAARPSDGIAIGVSMRSRSPSRTDCFFGSMAAT